MRRIIFLPLMALLLAADEPKRDTAVQDDQSALQGMWKTEKMIKGGNEAPADVIKTWKLECKGKRFIPHGDKHDDPADFALDASKSPKTIDIKPEGGETMKGIYELTGDRLKICFAEPGQNRPKEFKSPAGSDLILLVLKREKK